MIIGPHIHVFVLHVVDNVVAVDADGSQTEDARKHDGNCRVFQVGLKALPDERTVEQYRS